jgi:tetratricopeptide (TPR) repeat protein
MRNKHKKTMPVAANGLALLVFLSVAVLVGAGCTETSSSRSGIDSAPTPPPTKTEHELLVELERRFENPEAHFELARLYHRDHEWTKAEYRYQRALSFRPAFLAAQAGLVKLYVDEGESAKAAQFAAGYIRQAAGRTPDTLKLAWEFEHLGLDEYAVRCFRQALAEAPDSYDANKQMGLYYLSKGDTDNAKQYLSRSFELNPRQPDVAGALGRLGVVVESPEPLPPPAQGGK